MKKISLIEIFIIVLVVILSMFYFIPLFTLSREQKQYGRMQTNVAMMTSKILAEFSDNNNKKTPSEISKTLINEMNKHVKNPINKKNQAYSIGVGCMGCVSVAPNDKEKSITLTAYDKEGYLIARTLIQPPSYVKFEKDLNKNEK